MNFPCLPWRPWPAIACLLGTLLLGLVMVLPAAAQQVLPFPPKPSGSIALPTIQESVYSPLPAKSRLPKGAPNILIVLIDDVGPAQAGTYGGLIQTPTLDKIANGGISYNRFHTTAMCSPTRAALLTGRNQHRVHSGQITELANDWDGYSGTIERSSATVAQVLRDYGYRTGAWGKWHNTPALDTTAAGPFTYWPTGYGFEYFYGFLAGEASQYEPMLVRNTTQVEHPHTSGGHDYYHLSEDLADDAIVWLRQHRALAPDKPFLMYWAPGASHGPHQVPAAWADKYKGKFDGGWDKYRERAFENAKKLGWIPPNAKNTPRPANLASWDSIPESQRPFQRRLMELYAGFSEHADAQVGRVVDEIDRLGYGENTIVMYIWGDNGASAEGQNGTISELMAQNGIPSTTEQQIKALDALGGLAVLGTAKTDNMYHAGWAWAGGAPYKATKLVAGFLGGTRNPMAVRWPAKIKAERTPRSQFLHVNDVVPTLYDVLGIQPPESVDGIAQDPFDGISFAATFSDANAKLPKKPQYFEVMGSRAIYYDGWMASVFGPRVPWLPGLPNLRDWNPVNDKWELYHLDEDWSQADDLAAKHPEKVEAMKALFMAEFSRNNGLPVGGGLYTAAIRPDLRMQPPYTSWTFPGAITRIPEFNAPALGNRPNVTVVDAVLPADANGVLYALGGFSGGLTLYLKDGILSYEYNLFEIMRTHIRAKDKLPAGKARIEVETSYVERKPGGPLKVVLKVGGRELASGVVPVSAPLLFTANDGLDFGIDLGSPVGIEYFPSSFKFNGTIEQARVEYAN